MQPGDWLLMIVAFLLGVMVTAGAFAWYDIIRDWRDNRRDKHYDDER